MSLQSGIYHPSEPGLPMLAVVILGDRVIAKSIDGRSQGLKWIALELERQEANRLLVERYGRRPPGRPS